MEWTCNKAMTKLYSPAAFRSAIIYAVFSHVKTDLLSRSRLSACYVSTLVRERPQWQSIGLCDRDLPASSLTIGRAFESQRDKSQLSETVVASKT